MMIGNRVYRGPKSSSSTFRNWHSVSIRSIKVDKDGETIAYIKNSHGDNMGLRGYVKVSLDVMLVELNTRGKPSFKSPSSLFRQFYYGDVRFEYQKKVVEYHVEGGLTVNLAYLIYEGIYHNTSGHVYENEGGSKEIIGSPIDRALFKWAIQSEEDMGRVYNKADSTTIKGCSSNSMPRYSSVAVNCEIAGTRGVRIHWKGKASVILDKCTGILENNEYRKMTTSKKSQLKEAINRMAAQKLICIALAFKNSDSTCVPPHDRLNLWKFPFENLILLAEDDEIRAPIDFHENRNEEELRDSVWWDDGEICIAPESDSEVSDVPEDIKPHQWLDFYDIGLCGRLGLYCYNFQKGTDYEFKCVRNCYTEFGSLITLEAMNPANSSPLTFEMLVKHDDLTEGVQSWWETCICRVEGSKEADREWDNEAIDDRYKGEMPKWLSDDDLQHCYVVKDSELMETKNWWLLLFSEFAFYTKWPGTLRPRDAVECLPLETQKVVVETQGKAETEPREKLKAANAIFYISFECGNDPVTGKVANYRAVVRKTMDGKPGHMRLEVRCWSI